MVLPKYGPGTKLINKDNDSRAEKNVTILLLSFIMDFEKKEKEVKDIIKKSPIHPFESRDIKLSCTLKLLLYFQHI